MAAIGSTQEGVDFGAVEERHVGSIGPLWWYGKHSLDERGMLRVAEGSEPEHRVDGGQPGVAAADAVASGPLQVVEERGDGGRVEVVEVQLRGRLSLALLGEAEKEAERIPVGGDGVVAGPSLAD